MGKVGLTLETEQSQLSVSSELAGASNWEVLSQNIIGSDNYPAAIKFDINNVVQLNGIMKWKFGKTNWEIFTNCCD